MSSPVSTASRWASSTRPWASAPQVTSTTPAGPVGLEPLDQPGRHVALAQRLDHPLGRTVAGVDDHDPVAVGAPPLDVGDRASRRRRGSAARAWPRAHPTSGAPSASSRPNGLSDHQERSRSRAWARTSPSSRYDAAPRSIGAVPPPAAAAQLAPRNSSLVATRSWARLRARSGSSTSTWVSAGSRSTSSSISSTSDRRQRLHALDRDALGELVGELAQLGVRGPELGGPAAYVVGEQQLAARRRPQPVELVEGALVGDRERADLLDVVAPELHPQRVLLGRREDVDDAAADGELAAPLDQVDPGVRRVGQPAYDVVEVGRVPDRELDRLEVAEPLHLRLQHRAHRRDDHATAARWRRPMPGWHSRRSTASRRPTVSLRGLSRSCGSVSQLG